MKRKLIMITILFIGIVNCFAQMTDKSNKVETYKKLGKDAIVRMAVNQLISQYGKELGCWDLSAYIPKVYASDIDIKVIFELPKIVFLPINSSFYGTLSGSVIKEHFTMEVLANPSDFDCKINYLSQYLNSETLDLIDFVKESINKSTKIESFSEEEFLDKMIIMEHKDYYAITVKGGIQNTYYKVKKVLGEIYDVTHRHIKYIDLNKGFNEIVN